MPKVPSLEFRIETLWLCDDVISTLSLLRVNLL